MEVVSYITLGVVVLNGLISCWQSIKMNHFQSTCMDGKCFTVSDEITMQKKKETSKDEIELSDLQVINPVK